MSSSSWYVVAAVSAAGCSVGAAVVIVAGWRRRLAEVAILGAALLAVSVLPLTHALGGLVLGGPPGSAWAAHLALMAAGLTAAPLITTGGLRHRLVARWRRWTAVAVAVTIVLAGALLAVDAVPPSRVRVAVLVVGAIAASLLARRQLRLHAVSGLRASLMAAVSIALIAAASIAGSMTTAGSVGSWMVLTVENVGVLATVVAVLLGYRVRRDVADVLAPIVAFEPLSALEVGLSPPVHAFVAALDRKDRITRDHVVRTAALALRVAVRAGMPVRDVRAVAVGALLHDLGKLVVPSEILGKPGALNDDEFRQIRTHPEAGERILATAPGLAEAAPYVRWHHERFDGRGYPDRLIGDSIPLGVAIVSVADAWDAMTNTRQYRTGMDVTTAERLLRTGAGSQWHPRAVELVLAEIAAAGPARLDELDAVGRPSISGAPVAGCGCLDEILDEDLRSLLGV